MHLMHLRGLARHLLRRQVHQIFLMRKAMAVNRQILLVEKPLGKLGVEHFKMSKTSVPEPGDGEALMRLRYISLDAANRAWMHGATYRAAIETNTWF
jgi:NADPH-dependent curcumin reductase CurA